MSRAETCRSLRLLNSKLQGSGPLIPVDGVASVWLKTTETRRLVRMIFFQNRVTRAGISGT